MPKFDIHLHLALVEQKFNGHTFSAVEDMIPHLHKLGISRGVALSIDEKEGGSETNRQISAKYPDMFTWFCNFDEDRDPASVEDFLREQQKLGAKGLGEFVINERISDSPLIQAAFAAAEKLGLPVLFHMSPEAGFNYGIADDPGLPMLEEALQKYPNLKLIGHSQPVWIEISGDAPVDKEERNSWGQGPVVPGGRLPYLLEKYPNFYGDLSANSGGQAIMRDREFGLAFMEKFQDKLLFGTDMVSAEMEFPLGKYLDVCLADGSLSQKVYNKICEENAVKLLGL